MLCAKFGWNWSSGSWEKIFKFHQSLLGKGRGPSFEQTWIPFIQVSTLVEIGPVVPEKKIFLTSSMYFLLFSNYLLLEKGGALHWTNLNPLHPRMLCGKFGWNMEKKMKMWKDYDNNANEDGQRTNFDQKSSLEPSSGELIIQIYSKQDFRCHTSNYVNSSWDKCIST